MFVNRTHGVVAATLGALSFGIAGCDDPAQNTDLRPEGPPDVLAVLVLTDAFDGLYETATYCRPNDEKRPNLVGVVYGSQEEICPANLSQTVDEVTNAYPDGWYVRIMFDELLDPEIETLTEVLDEDGNGTDTYVGSIVDSQPVTLRCESVSGGMVTVDYDGYYSPSGNRLTWPLGPSLVIKPNDPTLVATSSQCEVTINDNVRDKSGNPVPSDQRGPYRFQIAPIEVLAIEPADDPDGKRPVDPFVVYDGVYVQFNTFVDRTSFCDEGTGGNECEFSFTPDEGGVGFLRLSPASTEYVFYTGPGHVDTMYTFQFLQGGTIRDRCGKEQTFGAPSAADQTLTRFLTGGFDFKNASIANGETASPLKKLALRFTNVVDPGSLVKDTDYTISPEPLNLDVDLGAGNDPTLYGFFKINTEYTFTLNAGATIEDAYGEVYTQAAPLTIAWKTQPAITATFAPADNATITKATATSPVGVTLSFNTAIKTTDVAAPATRTTDELTEGTEFTLTDGNGTAVTGLTIDTPDELSCTEYGSSCVIRIRKDLPPDTYIFTLKAGATLTDQHGDIYTQAADRVIHFTVKAPVPPPPAADCL
jgi:hypothetical protein